MIIIGEKINSTLKAVRPAIENYDAEVIKKLAIDQTEAGATYIDVNAGTFIHDEPERLKWLVETVQSVVKTPLAIDSPNPEAMRLGLLANKNGKPVLNSITAETPRWNEVIPMVREFKTAIVALTMDDTGMPETAKERVDIAERLINNLTKEGVAIDDIFIDPLIRPIGTGSHYGHVALDTIRTIKTRWPEVHITCGLSNISFGIPMRKLMNTTFMIAAVAAGMDGAILDPLDSKMMAFMYAAEALMGADEFCMEYIMQYRDGFFDGVI